MALPTRQNGARQIYDSACTTFRSDWTRAASASSTSYDGGRLVAEFRGGVFGPVLRQATVAVWSFCSAAPQVGRSS